MNLQLGNALCTVLTPTSESDVTIGPKLSLVKNSKTNVNSNSRQTKSPKCKKQANLAIQSASQTPSQSPSREEDSTIYICPVCESQIENQASICCDTCDVWIHFSCANVDPDNAKELEDSEYICQICVDNALHIAKHKSPNMKTPLLAKENTYPLETHVQCEETLVKQPIQSLHVVEIHDVSTSDPITESSQTSETPISHRNLTLSNHEINKTQSIIDTPGIPSPGIAPLVTSVEQETESAQPVSKKQTSTKPVKRKQESEHKQYIITLEKQVKEHEKTIHLLQKNVEALSNTSNSNAPSSHAEQNNLRSQIPPDLEMRIRQLEMQNMQNLCIFTALTSTMAMQQSNIQQRSSVPQFHAQFGYPSVVPQHPMQFMQPQVMQFMQPQMPPQFVPPCIPHVVQTGQPLGIPQFAPRPPPPPYQNHFMQNQYLSQGLFHPTPVQNHVNPVVTQHIRPPIAPSNLPYQPVFQNQSNGQSVNPPILENKVSEKQSGLTVQGDAQEKNHTPQVKSVHSPVHTVQNSMEPQPPVVQNDVGLNQNTQHKNKQLQGKRPINDRNAVNGSIYEQGVVSQSHAEAGSITQTGSDDHANCRNRPQNTQKVCEIGGSGQDPGKLHESSKSTPNSGTHQGHSSTKGSGQNNVSNSFLCIPGLTDKPPDKIQTNLHRMP